MASTSPPGPADLPRPRIPMTMLRAPSRRSNPHSTCLRLKAHCDRRGCVAAHAHALRSSPVCLSRRVHHLSGSRLHLRGRARHANGPGAVADSVCLGIHGLLHCLRRLRDAHGVAGRPLGAAADADPHRRLLVSVHDLHGYGPQPGYAADDAHRVRRGRGRRLSDALARAVPVVPAATSEAAPTASCGWARDPAARWLRRLRLH